MKKYYLISIVIFSVCFCSCGTDPGGIEQSGFKWETAAAGETGLNQELVNAGFDAAHNTGFVNGIVIIRHGKICAEKYFNGKNSESYQTIRSVSKSFLSAMVGIAVNKGIMNLDQKVVDLLPEYKNVNDRRFANITLRHLLTMRSGIKGDEEFYTTFTNSGNWVHEIANSPLKFEPGVQRLYSTASTHLISAMLSRATGMSAYTFGNENLFKPMKLAIKGWSKDPQGLYFGGNDMFFTTRDIAVLGLLYLNKGKLNGVTIVPEDWVNTSISYSFSSSSWGKMNKIGYGFLWWSGELDGHKMFFALGHGGQYVMCFPDYELIVATTSYPDGTWDSADQQERVVNQITADYFLKALL